MSGRVGVAAAVGVLIGTTAIVRSQTPKTSSSLAITNVTVIDTVSGALQPGMTVVVAGDRITEVGPAARVRAAEDAQHVDGRGRFLIPGLWDMHVHWYDAGTLPLWVANGVTGTRVMWGFPVHHEWRKQIASGTLIGPRMVIGSPILDGPQPVLRRMTSMVTPEDAGREVARAKDGGAEFIKIYLKLPRQLFFAVAEESKRNSISFVGHVPASVSVLEATRAGQRSIEHDGVLLGASSREHDLARALARAFSSTPERQPNGADLRPYLRMAVDTFDRERVTRLSAELKRNHTSVCPTLTVFRPMWRVADEGFRADPRLKYLPRGLRDRFESFGKEPRSGDDVELWRRYYEIHSASVGHMRDAGVQLLAGTDGGEPYSFPAFGLHDELRLLVDAGLSPLAALQTATLNPARFFGREQDLGTIDEGKVADLVLLDASPLTAIGNTTKVNAVVANGRLFRRADLDELLAQAERAAKE